MVECLSIANACKRHEKKELMDEVRLTSLCIPFVWYIALFDVLTLTLGFLIDPATKWVANVFKTPTIFCSKLLVENFNISGTVFPQMFHCYVRDCVLAVWYVCDYSRLCSSPMLLSG